MTSLLHIDSSARGAPFSRKVAADFVAEWRAVHPAGGYAYRDLGAHPVPPVDEAAPRSRYRRRQQASRNSPI